MKRAARVFRSFEQNTGIVILVALYIDVVLQVMTRILPGKTFGWSLEMAQILMGMLIWTGLPMAIRDMGLVKLDFIINRFPPKIRKALTSIANIVLIIYLCLMSIYTRDLVLSYLRLGTKTSMLSINQFYVKLPVLIGCVMAIIRTVCIELYKWFPSLNPFKEDEEGGDPS